jgi:hypothetical protein
LDGEIILLMDEINTSDRERIRIIAKFQIEVAVFNIDALIVFGPNGAAASPNSIETESKVTATSDELAATVFEPSGVVDDGVDGSGGRLSEDRGNEDES